MSSRVGVLQFLGTNCDRDVMQWAEHQGFSARLLWHADHFSIQDFDLIVLPGGFSYGDYLRSGALAARAPAMNSVRDFAKAGRPVLGICNGFQILTEAGLLPGALVRNSAGRFIDDWAELEVVNATPLFKTARTLRLPIANGDGRFYCSPAELEDLQSHRQIWMRYRANPNGSIGDIAGLMNRNRNVFALMPHPERALFEWAGGTDGAHFLEGLQGA